MLKRVVLTAVTGLAMITGVGLAHAQPPDEEPLEQPRPLIGAAASCRHDTADVRVFIYEDRDEPYDVLLVGTTGSATRSQPTTFLEEDLAHTTTFENVAVGEYVVAVEGEDDPGDGFRVVVSECADLDPGADVLEIDVECRAGWGVVTFQVANPATGERASYTLGGGAFDGYDIELSPGLFVRVTENGYEDRTYLARLRGDGLDVTREFTVACESGNAPALQVNPACDDATGRVGVEVRNVNRTRVDYTVILKEETRSVSVPAGEHGTVTFSEVPDGTHPVLVTGSDGTEAAGVAEVDCAVETTTPTTTTTTTTTTTGSPGSSGSTTTAVAAPQARSGGLASTGAAVGGLAGLGALVLALGALLLIVGRRRRAHR